MRLWELLEDITPADIKSIERSLDAEVYQPPELVKKNKPVIDLELPVGNAHFMQRIIQRADKARISADEIKDLLYRAKTDPSLGYAKEIDALSKKNNPDDSITIQDPKTKLTIPVIAKPNQVCKSSSVDGVPVCLTQQGKAPKNKLTAKTIFRKGVDD